MEPWQLTLQKFIERYENEPYFEGAVLCGSYASGNQNDRSDIDVHMVINNDQAWRERGNLEIDGFLIEYFINPAHKILSNFEKEHQSGSITTANMFGYGVVLSDKNGVVAHIQQAAQDYIHKELKPASDFTTQNNLYHLWDRFDELNTLYESGQHTALQYNLLLSDLIKTYFAQNKIPDMPLSKIERLLTDSDFQQRYHVSRLPSQQFIDLFVRCLTEQSPEAIADLYAFVVADCGGFDITRFKLHSSL